MLGGLLAMRLRRPAGPVTRLTVTVCALAAGAVAVIATRRETLGG